MQIFAGVHLGEGVKRHSTLCKKYAKMTATVILYIRFSLYNCREKTTQTVWKTWKTREFHFAKFVRTLIERALETYRSSDQVVYKLLIVELVSIVMKYY